MKRSLLTGAWLLVSVLLAACSSGPQKAPKCKGKYTPINAPERYVVPADKENLP